MPIYPNFYQTLTPCPVVELRGYAAANGLKGRLFAYLDFNGPTGTARDGLAEGMLALAIEQKKLAPGQPIIEAVSGPFATALTLAGLTAGHPVVLVMPEDAPALRQENLLRLGAQIQHSPARSGLAGARAMAAQTAAANGWYYTDWLANDNNPEYHRRVTGPAILQNIAREGASLVDAITVGVGSAGTVTGFAAVPPAKTRTPAKDSSAVSEQRQPILSSRRLTVNPGVPLSITSSEMPAWPGPPVRTAVVTKSARTPEEMKVLAPLTT